MTTEWSDRKTEVMLHFKVLSYTIGTFLGYYNKYALKLVTSEFNVETLFLTKSVWS